MLSDVVQSNAKFAVAVDGSNEKLQQRKQTIDILRQKVTALPCLSQLIYKIGGTESTSNVSSILQPYNRNLIRADERLVLQHPHERKSCLSCSVLSAAGAIEQRAYWLWRSRLSAYRWTALQGEATVPSNMGDEIDTNPFLRPSDPSIRRKLGEHS